MVKKTESRKNDGKIFQLIKMLWMKKNRTFTLTILIILIIGAYVIINDTGINFGDYSCSSKSNIEKLRKK